MSGITLCFHENARHRRALKSFARWYVDNHPIDHSVSVEVFPRATLEYSETDGPGWRRGTVGRFWWDETRTDTCVDIEVASARSMDVDAVVDTLAHELVHYEQWRSGRKATERGVAVRARALRHKWEAATV